MVVKKDWLVAIGRSVEFYGRVRLPVEQTYVILNGTALAMPTQQAMMVKEIFMTNNQFSESEY